MKDTNQIAVEAGEVARLDAPAPSIFTILPYIMLPMALAVADQTIVSTALPAIAQSLGGVERISWIVVANLVAGVAAAPVYGQLRDVHGSRLMMTISLTIYMLGATLCALAPTFGALVAGRFVQGLGGGGLMTLSQAIIGETIPPRDRARYQGYLAAVVVTASTAGPLLGGLLTGLFGWRGVFAASIPLGLLAMRVIRRGADTFVVAPRALSFDYPGLVLFFGFIAPCLLGLDMLRHLGPGAIPSALLLLAVAAASLFTLLWQERHAFSPLFPIALLRQRTIWMSDTVALCHGATLVALGTLLPIYLHVTRGASPSESGLALLPLMGGIGTGSMLTGRMVSRTGRTAIFPSVGLTIAALLLAYQAVSIDAWSARELGWWLLVAGLSMGTVMSVVQVTVQSAAGREQIGSAAASVQISRTVGAALGATVVVAVLFAVLQQGDPTSAEAFAALFNSTGAGAHSAGEVARSADIVAAFRAAFLAIAVFPAIGAVIAWTIPTRRL